MANPPPVRPWFRLASIRSTQPPPPLSAPSHEPPRTTMVLPAFRTSSAPPSPQEHSSQPNRFSSSSSSSLPTSPFHKTSSPTHSPKTIKQSDHTPMQSPNKNKNTTPPPSPLTLPPSQLIPEQAEPKTVLVQETIDRPKPNPRHNNESTKSKEKGVERKVNSESDMRVITIAGENRGAYMELKKHDPKYLVQNKKEVVESEEVNVNKKDHKVTFPMSAYMNSNVQCVNNSLLYHTCCSHHDPGVHLSLSNKEHHT